MKEYQKIKNIFKFDEKFRNIIGINEPFNELRSLDWEGTEKVDGTNIRVHWDGHNVEVAGRTDKAEIPSHLMKVLSEKFLTQEAEYIFEQKFGNKEVFLYGEGYGPKIQKDGEKYIDHASFILFDVNINGYDLSRQAVNELANQLGLEKVPVVFTGTLDEAIEFVKCHPNSEINKEHEMEGLVLIPKFVQIYDAEHELVKCKCKYRDIVKGGLQNNDNR